MANFRFSLPVYFLVAFGAILVTLAECRFPFSLSTGTTATNTLSPVSLFLNSNYDRIAAFQRAHHKYLLELRGGGEEEDTDESEAEDEESEDEDDEDAENDEDEGDDDDESDGEDQDDEDENDDDDDEDEENDSAEELELNMLEAKKLQLE